MRRTWKKARKDVADRALELVCRWLHRHKMVLDEKVATGDLNVSISLWSPGGKTEFKDEDFPEWDWEGRPVPKEDAILAVAKWLFREKGNEYGNGPSAVIEEVSCDVAPGRRRVEIRTELIPKFSFSSLEEFVLKAEAFGEFREG